ncbi:Hypothetical predicted protein [Cloeon dipterum]|uniref:Adenylate kinase isoenzyme 6 homolog n=1 Tax=Cloeon dipterum TaxID=197152 RepID=A0A8S1C8N3_9INSE|nr:Hypothetical predicted protein [Cloeon dipterum]
MEMPSGKRSKPNIMVTGTPGVGKSSLCEQISEITGFEWIQIGNFAKENDCLDEFDEEYKCPVLNEDRLIDELEETMSGGGVIVDYHGCDFFPERWFDIVFVLRTDNTQLFDRLRQRGYSGKKLEDNIQCEIFQTILEEAKESYAQEIVHELQSNTPEDMESNVERICSWVDLFLQNNE